MLNELLVFQQKLFIQQYSFLLVSLSSFYAPPISLLFQNVFILIMTSLSPNLISARYFFLGMANSHSK